MSSRQLLDQLLQQGQALARQASTRLGAPAHENKGGGAGGAAGGLGSLLSGFGGGALSGGALGLLLGNKKLRKAGGSVALYGGMAALGVLAYKAYGNWQAQQAATAGATGGAAITHEPQTMDRLPPEQAERHSAAVLSAMIAAAKADGHIGQPERELLETELAKLSTEAGERQWLEAELAKPLDPAAVAKIATSPEMAAEMYLASLIMVDEESFMERAYLDELARQMKLDPALKTQLEMQLKQAA